MLEVIDLLQPTIQRRRADPPDFALTRALGRAGVVILSSHLEGYIDALNIEAVDLFNRLDLPSSLLPEPLRLLHSRFVVEALAATNWEGTARARLLEEFVREESWLWGTSFRGRIEPDRLLMWMKSPTPKALKRYFRYWGIEDIFARITRKEHIRSTIWMRLTELVDKRNSIAHGDIATAATRSDVQLYLSAVKTFAARADSALAKQIGRTWSIDPPW